MQATPVRMEQLVLIAMEAVAMFVSVLLGLREPTVKMVRTDSLGCFDVTIQIVS